MVGEEQTNGAAFLRQPRLFASGLFRMLLNPSVEKRVIYFISVVFNDITLP